MQTPQKPAAPEKRVHIPYPDSTRQFPFSSAVIVGSTAYLAGHLGLDPATHSIPDDLETEVHIMMNNFATPSPAPASPLTTSFTSRYSVQTFLCSIASTPCTPPTSNIRFRPEHSSAPAPCSSALISKFRASLSKALTPSSTHPSPESLFAAPALSPPPNPLGCSPKAQTSPPSRARARASDLRSRRTNRLSV